MTILQGTMPDGTVVPIQADSQGRLVAEGLQGPQGPQGPQGEPGIGQLPPNPQNGDVLAWDYGLVWVSGIIPAGPPRSTEITGITTLPGGETQLSFATTQGFDEFAAGMTVTQLPESRPETSAVASVSDSPIWKLVPWLVGDINNWGGPQVVPSVLQYNGAAYLNNANFWFWNGPGWDLAHEGWIVEPTQDEFVYLDFNNARSGYTIDCSGTAGGSVNEVGFGIARTSSYRGVPSGEHLKFNATQYLLDCNSSSGSKGAFKEIKQPSGSFLWISAVYVGNAAGTNLRRVYHDSQVPTAENGGLGTLLTFQDAQNFDAFSEGDEIDTGVFLVEKDTANATWLVTHTDAIVPSMTFKAPNVASVTGLIQSIDAGPPTSMTLQNVQGTFGPPNAGFYVEGEVVARYRANQHPHR